MLSGFLTHYSSINKPLRTRPQLLSFHAARLGRILPLHYLLVALSVGYTGDGPPFEPGTH